VNKLSYVNPLMGFGIMVGQRGLMCLLLWCNMKTLWSVLAPNIEFESD
jgi:hypothetical protein